MELKLDEWATIPPAGYPGVVQPPPSKRRAGWANGEEAPAGYFNYAFDALADTQNEIANLITGAGLTRVEDDLSQVLAAVNRLVNRRAELAGITNWYNIGTTTLVGNLAVGPTSVVAVSASSPYLRVLRRTDSTWTTPAPGSGAGIFYDVCWASYLGNFIAVGDNGEVQASLDGSSWTRLSTGGATPRVCVASGEALAAMCDDKSIKTSPTGTAWTTRVSAFPSVLMTGLAYSPEAGVFCAIGGPNIQRGTPDGVTWTASTSPTASNLNGIIWSDLYGKFFAWTNKEVFSSLDGASWTLEIGTYGGTENITHVAALPEHLLVCTDSYYVRMHWHDALGSALRVKTVGSFTTFEKLIYVPVSTGMYDGRLLGVSAGQVRASQYLG